MDESRARCLFYFLGFLAGFFADERGLGFRVFGLVDDLVDDLLDVGLDFDEIGFVDVVEEGLDLGLDLADFGLLARSFMKAFSSGTSRWPSKCL